MASLYKKPVVTTDPKTGKKVKARSKKWWGRYREENGVEKRVPLATDKTAAKAMLNERVRKAERKAAGLEDPFEKHRKRPLSEHLQDYTKYLTDKGSSSDHVDLTTQRITDVIDECDFELIDHISASRVQAFLGVLRGRGRSIATSNHYLRAIKMFTRWLVRDRRTNDDRLAYLSKMNADTDRRHIRRALSTDEFTKLLQAAERGPELQGISGPDRAILYIVAAYTGYRRNEIGSVRPTSFDFISDPPTMTVQAGYSKRRRHDVVPLRADFAKRIQAWMTRKADLQTNVSLFDVTDKRTSGMIRKDLESAGIPYADQLGRVIDFHSLRMTFITNLSRAGVTPKTAQTLARHSDINLTMNTYTMIGVLDQASAVESPNPFDQRCPACTRTRGYRH
jgi:integrase